MRFSFGKAIAKGGWVLDRNNEKLVFRINDDTGTAQNARYNIKGASLQDEWHHVAVTIDIIKLLSPQVLIFLDGVDVYNTTLNKTGAWGAIQIDITIGALAGGATSFFTSLIDDVRTAHGMFTESEIAYDILSSVPSFYLISTVEYRHDHQNG